MATKAFDTNLVGFRKVLGDFARSFMFKVSIPVWVPDSQKNELSILTRSITLPAFKLHSETIGFQGLKMNVATTAEFDPTWTVKILADENQVIRNNIVKWMSVAYDAGTMEASTLEDYKMDNFYVQQLDRTGGVVSTYKFFGMYPESVTNPEMNHDTLTPQDFSVTFKYDFFTFNLGAADAVTMAGTNQVPAIGTGSDPTVIGASKEASKQKAQNGTLLPKN